MSLNSWTFPSVHDNIVSVFVLLRAFIWLIWTVSDPYSVLAADFLWMNNNQLLAAILHQTLQSNWLHTKTKLDKGRSEATLWKLPLFAFVLTYYSECGCIIGFITFLTFVPDIVFITGHNCVTGWKCIPPSALKVVASRQSSISFLDTNGKASNVMF